jgi:hypothetical protein
MKGSLFQIMYELLNWSCFSFSIWLDVACVAYLQESLFYWVWSFKPSFWMNFEYRVRFLPCCFCSDLLGTLDSMALVFRLTPRRQDLGGTPISNRTISTYLRWALIRILVLTWIWNGASCSNHLSRKGDQCNCSLRRNHLGSFELIEEIFILSICV